MKTIGSRWKDIQKHYQGNKMPQQNKCFYGQAPTYVFSIYIVAYYNIAPILSTIDLLFVFPNFRFPLPFFFRIIENTKNQIYQKESIQVETKIIDQRKYLWYLLAGFNYNFLYLLFWMNIHFHT